jgi:hypothetical protein
LKVVHDDDDHGSDDFADVVLVGEQMEDEPRWPVLRHREDRVEVGELRSVREGYPMAPTGEVVRLKPRKEHGRLFDVEVLADLDEPEAARSGPAQVATEAYRLGWDVTFGRGAGEKN